MNLRRAGLIAILTITSLPALAFQASSALPDGAGKPEVQATCTTCHTSAVFVDKQMTRDDWNHTVSKMQGLGAKVSDDNFNTIAGYLAAHFGLTPNATRQKPEQPERMISIMHKAQTSVFLHLPGDAAPVTTPEKTVHLTATRSTAILPKTFSKP